MASRTGNSGASRRRDKNGAARLAALRREMGWSPEALGSKADVSGKWIREIEKTGHEPTESIKARLAHVFGMLPSDIWVPKASPLSPTDLSRLRDLRQAERMVVA